MAKRIAWNDRSIVVDEDGETALNLCERGDAFVQHGAEDDENGWYVTFVGVDGTLYSLDTPFDSPDEAVADVQRVWGECDDGSHSWIDEVGKLPADTPCNYCGELYGHPD